MPSSRPSIPLPVMEGKAILFKEFAGIDAIPICLATTDKDEIVNILTQITGQKPIINKARKAVSAFKIRKGLEIGTSVTLRGDRMWHFFDKLVNITLPRTKDFRGLSPKSFDGSGNYSLGIEDHTVFVEIDSNNVTKIRSLEVTIVTTAKTDKEGKLLLDKFGFPFKKDVNKS